MGVGYYPYGKELRAYHNGAQEKYVTTHHERDAETGLDYRGARFYDSDIGRFLSLDPLAKDFASWSAYNYVVGNPIRLIDSDGRSPDNPFARLANAAKRAVDWAAKKSEQAVKYTDKKLDQFGHWVENTFGEPNLKPVKEEREGGGGINWTSEEAPGATNEYEPSVTGNTEIQSENADGIAIPGGGAAAPGKAIDIVQKVGDIREKVDDVKTSVENVKEVLGVGDSKSTGSDFATVKYKETTTVYEIDAVTGDTLDRTSTTEIKEKVYSKEQDYKEDFDD